MSFFSWFVYFLLVQIKTLLLSPSIKEHNNAQKLNTRSTLMVIETHGCRQGIFTSLPHIIKILVYLLIKIQRQLISLMTKIMTAVFYNSAHDRHSNSGVIILPFSCRCLKAIILSWPCIIIKSYSFHYLIVTFLMSFPHGSRNWRRRRQWERRVVIGWRRHWRTYVFPARVLKRP